MRSPTKPKEPLSKVLPLRWSFGSKDRIRRQVRPGELVEYLESGRRPRCTKDPIISLVATPPQRAAQGRTLAVGQNHDSPSSSSLSHTDSCYSPKTPEGQSRSESQVAGTGQNGSLRFTKEARQDQGRNPDLLLQRGAILGGQVSHSAPQSRDSTLRRVQIDGTSRTQKDPLQNHEDRSGPRGHEDQNQDLLSLLRPAFMKRDNPRCPVNRLLSNVTGGDSAYRSQSNGSLEDRKANGTGPRLPEPADIQRAHSSSNIQTKPDLAFGRFSSLQRNGDASVPALHRVLLSDQHLLPG